MDTGSIEDSIMTDKSKREAIQEIILAYDRLFIFKGEPEIVQVSAEDAQRFLNTIIKQIEDL